MTDERAKKRGSTELEREYERDRRRTTAPVPGSVAAKAIAEAGDELVAERATDAVPDTFEDLITQPHATPIEKRALEQHRIKSAAVDSRATAIDTRKILELNEKLVNALVAQSNDNVEGKKWGRAQWQTVIKYLTSGIGGLLLGYLSRRC